MGNSPLSSCSVIPTFRFHLTTTYHLVTTCKNMYRPVRSCDLESPVTLSRRSLELRSKTTELFRATSSRLSARLSNSPIGETRSSQKFHSVDSAFQTSSRNSQALQEADDSDSDVEPLDDGHSIIRDRGESLQANEKASLRSLHDEDAVTDLRLGPPRRIEQPVFEVEGGISEVQLPNLRSRLVTAKVKNEEGQFFIPVDVVSRLVTTSTIRDELLASSLDTNTLSDPDGFIQHVSESAKKVFAILALIGRVVDITVFTLAGIRDHNLPLKIDALKSLTSNFKQSAEIQAHYGLDGGYNLSHWPVTAFDDFYGTQWQVLTPYFTTIPSEIYHYELEDNVVLPFINDPSIQRSEMIRGGFGTVCRTQIHAGQYSESWGQRRDQSTFVAVKEIPASNRKAFEREVSNLRMVSRLEASDHLIKLKASVRHKGSYYLVFDWAGGGNLRDLWQSKAPTVRNAPSQKWMLEQLTGLAKGLAQLHSYTPGGRGEPGGTFRHGDIKPENILFFKNSDSPQNTGKLVLADFGLGRLRADDNRPRRLQGTPTYRAPECDLPEGKISKAYDIWSFGCVILELLIWYMEGSTMLDEFAAARSQSMSFRTPFRKRLARTSLETERNRADDCFFDTRILFDTSSPARPVVQLNPSVTKWIKRLREHPRCSDVLSDLIDLIEYRMLVTDPGQRIDSRSFSTELGAMAARLLRNPEYGQSPRPTGKLPNKNHCEAISSSPGHQHAGLEKVLMSGPEEQEEASSTSGDVNAKAQVQDSWKSHPETPIPTYAPLANMRIMYGQPSCWPFRRIFDGLRRWAEQGLNTKVDWWPLPAIHPELAATEVMLIWEYGGRKMSIVADRAEAERLLKSEVQVNKSSSPVEIPATAKPPVSKRIHQALLTALWICLSLFALGACINAILGSQLKSITFEWSWITTPHDIPPAPKVGMLPVSHEYSRYAQSETIILVMSSMLSLLGIIGYVLLLWSYMNGGGASGGILPSCQGSTTTSTSNTNTAATSGAASIKSWTSSASTFFSGLGKGSKSQVNTSPGQSPQVPVKINPWKETYLCVDRCWTSATETRLSTLDSIDTMTDDSDFFREARRVLGQARGTRFQRFLSWRAYTHVDLSQFHFLFDNNTLVKTFSCASLTKTPICQGYDYNCSQATDIDIHMSIISEIILHGIRSPDLGKGQKTVLDGIPKRKAPPELPKKAKESGWGFHTGQGPSLRKVISWFLGILFFAVGFVPIWLASINKIDLQNAFAPGTFLVTVFAIIVACYAVMEGVS